MEPEVQHDDIATKEEATQALKDGKLELHIQKIVFQVGLHVAI